MSKLMHNQILYNSDSGFDNYIDPITKSPFSKGETVVVCSAKNSLISLRSLRANHYQCPFCSKQLNSNLTIDRPIDNNNNGRDKKPYTPQPSRSQISSSLWIGIAFIMLFCFILLASSGLFASNMDTGTTNNPIPTNTRIRPTSTEVFKVDTPKPKPTSTSRPRPTNTLVSNTKYATISNEIYFVNLRKSPGYSSKDDKVDVIVEVPSGSIVTILDGPRKADGLNWWYVEWRGYKGWIADKTGSGKTILIFN